MERAGERAARRRTEEFVVLEGDDGGQVYAAFPAARVRCGDGELRQLLADLDAIAWPGNDADAARLARRPHVPGEVIGGGMGGGVAAPQGWVHRQFEDLGLGDHIREVVAGRRARIDVPGRR